VDNDLYSPVGDNEPAFSAPVVVVLLCIWSLLAIGIVWLVAFLLT
jgi:hypothetical protein